MTINNISGSTIINPANTKLSSSISAKEQITPTSAVDKVDMPIIQLIKSSLATSKEVPVNNDAVANLKQAIQDGDYKIDANRVAQKIIQFENAQSK